MNRFPPVRRVLNVAALISTAALAVLLSASPVIGSAFGPGLAGQSGSSSVPLNPDHPDRYVVKRGDTLWDISAMFLRDPWFWPEIWYVNPQVENPHLIYPGDVLTLVYVDGRPQIRLERGVSSGTERLSPRVREEDLDEAIRTIPFDVISAFLRKGAVLQKEEIDQLPYIVALRDDHLVAGAGNDVYVRGEGIAENDGYSVVHVGDPLVDPDNDDIVGYEGIFVGEGTIRRGGDPSTLLLNRTRREATRGDRLLNLNFDIPLNFYPRSPETEIDGRIIHVVDGISRIGQYNVAVLNRGARDGLDAGHVLRIWQAGETVKDQYSNRVNGEKVTLPDEAAGILMVFKTYDRISYALVLEASSEIKVLDKVRNPT